jgi:hypothetical protein
VENAAAGGHPLHIAVVDDATTSLGVLVLHGAVHHVGDGLDAPVGVPWETCHEVVWIVAPELVQQHEGVHVVQLGLGDDAVEVDTRTVGHVDAPDHPRHASNVSRHSICS